MLGDGDSDSACRIAEWKLLRLLVREVLRDGGITSASMLCQHGGDNVTSLLHQCRHRKLLAFLQQYPDMFAIQSQGSQHIVRLLDAWDQHVSPSTVVLEDSAAFLAATSELQNRCVGALRYLVAKRQRRTRSDEPRAEDVLARAAPIECLLGRVQLQVHGAVRLSHDCRPNGEIPLSARWQSAVVDFLLQFLDARPSMFVVLRRTDGDDYWPPGVYVALTVAEEQDDRTAQSRLSLAFAPSELENIRDRLLSIMRGKGLRVCSSIGIGMAGIYKDGIVRALLKGRSLLQALESDSLASTFECYRGTTRNSAWYVRVPTGLGEDHADFNPKYGPGSLAMMLDADEEGLYSMTSHRAAAAMATVLARFFAASTGQEPTAAGSVCVDMTAGVGCITIALTRSFHTVHAYEIDAARYAQMQANLRAHGVAERVQSWCCCSLRAMIQGSVGLSQPSDGSSAGVSDVSTLHGIFRGSTSAADGIFPYEHNHIEIDSHTPLPAAVLDPPWGGLHYKQEVEPCLKLAGQSLVGIVQLLVGRVSVLGIKLPLSFDTKEFCASLPTSTVLDHVSKRVRRQKFLCLKLAAKQSLA